VHRAVQRGHATATNANRARTRSDVPRRTHRRFDRGGHTPIDTPFDVEPEAITMMLSHTLPMLLLAALAAGGNGVARADDDATLVATEAPASLAPGEFDWHPEASPEEGPVLVVVSIGDQLAYVYRNGVRIGTTTVSTGRPGYSTPTGVFEILEKKRVHFSNKYDDAPMPFMQRLTWDGVAMHAGRVPGRPASHGCVRLPPRFAERLFDVTYRGGTVVVTDFASGHTLDFAAVPADMARLVFEGPSWRDAALPAVTGDATGFDEAATGAGGVARAD
jgi:hypothetical protein